ncbi:MAG: glucose-6-phosphate isomerase family protein [Breznakia sp.]
MDIYGPAIQHDFMNGILQGKEVEKYVKKYKDAKHFYKNVDVHLSEECILYEVYSFKRGGNEVGNLNWGLTLLKPMNILGECNMTRGHFHKDLNSAELYFGFAGKGLLLLMDDKGVCYSEKVFPGSIHHINGRLAHRLINIGETDMKVGACWPVQSGHDYERIEKFPFRVRVFKDGEDIKIEEEE